MKNLESADEIHDGLPAVLLWAGILLAWWGGANSVIALMDLLAAWEVGYDMAHMEAYTV